MSKLSNYKGHIAILAANLFLGIHIPVSKALLADWMTPTGYMLVRILFATVIFWGVGLFMPKEKVTAKDLMLIALGGLFGFTLGQYSFALALKYTSPVNVSLMVALSPVVVMLLAALFLKEKITRNKVVGVTLAIAGAALLILRAGQAGSGSNDMLGILIMAFNITSYSLYIIITGMVSGRYSGVTLMKWMYLTNLVFVVPMGLGGLSSQPVFTTGGFTTGWWLLIYVLIFSTTLAYFLMPVGLKTVKATTVSVYMNLQPIVASVVAIIAKQDTFTWDKPVALALVIAGAYIVSKHGSGK
ncbi:MAG: DMT family transporter [Alistipes sp.]|nr:DMT family transporter [Alistipes sp.]